VSTTELQGWDRLRHGGLLLDAPRLRRLAEHVPDPLPFHVEKEFRQRAAATVDGNGDVPGFVAFVLERVCGFAPGAGAWQRGSQVGAEWSRRVVTGETVRPRQLWQGAHGAILPVFIDAEARLGMGRGRKAASQAVQWLRAGGERLALLTNGRQWRLVFAGLDFDAWCEWDADLWFEEGGLAPQVHALRTLVSPALWTPPPEGAQPPLLEAILDSRKGQAELSAVLGERVREAVELLVQAHGEALKERCAGVDPAGIYRAAVRVVMRMVVVLFAESRELLPRENALYHGAYGLTGLLEGLERITARGGNRLARSWNAWPRVLALFRLVRLGSHHQALPVPAYGGELFAEGDPASADGLSRALAVFESACFESEVLSDRDVHRILERLTRTRVKVRQGRASTWVPAPVDFSDLSSEYIGILYEGLLDFELRTAPPNDPVIFLAVGNQPALPLSRLEAMDDRAIASLLEAMKDTSADDDEADEDVAVDPVEVQEPEDAGEASDEDAAEEAEDTATEETGAGIHDERHTTRTRAETWARRAVEVGKLTPKPKGAMTPEKRLAHEAAVSRKARQLVSRVILPGEWYLVRWGGTRKGSGTFYTRPGLAVPTVQRTLRPLAYTPPTAPDGTPDVDAPHAAWTPKTPEEILALRVCDPAAGSGTFPVAALRFLTEALFASLHHHGRITADGDRAIVRLLAGPAADGTPEERLSHELLPCRPDDPLFEPRLRAVLRRHVVERSIYGVDLDPLAVELCRLALWIETMDRTLPFSFLDHKIKCGNALVGAWFDQFQHYPVMAWKNREGGDRNHANGVHFHKDARGQALKAFVKDRLTSDLRRFLGGRTLFSEDLQEQASTAHAEALATLSRLHELPVQDAADRGRIYREELLGSAAYRSLKSAMDLWCACWFWPAGELDHAPLPTTLAAPPEWTRATAEAVAARKRFFHWELEFPDVFRAADSGFDAILGNPPWDIAKPNSKEFFSSHDPLYRSYGKQEALRYQSDYFRDAAVERAWLDYSADFRAQSNALKYLATPFGDPQDAESSADRFTIARGKENDGAHARWRAARAKSPGFADPAHPFRHQGSGDINLYKAFLEQTHALLRHSGRLGFIVPSGLYSDHGTSGLRRLFLDDCSWEWLFGFENREKVFDIDSRFKFNPVIIQKGGTTTAIRTAFMRRKLDDWELAETLATPYARAQVDRFSPRSKAILEIQSRRDLEILEKIYANSVLLGDDGPNGWGIKYATEFHMTNDSKLFSPRPKWEADGYRPDEYSRWLKGNWRPIAELWAELGVKPLPPGERRCAQPPYDTLPILRADIPAGFVLSRSADLWIREEGVEGVALPLYEGRMVGQLDFSQKGWVSGTGRGAVWQDIGWDGKQIEPQYLLALRVWQEEALARYLKEFARLHGKEAAEAEEDRLRDPEAFGRWWWVRRRKVAFIDVTSATNARTMLATPLAELPCGNSAPVLHGRTPALLAAVLNSFAYDAVARFRCSGLHLNWFVIEESALPRPHRVPERSLAPLALALACPSPRLAEFWITDDGTNGAAWRAQWALTEAERLRLRCVLDAIVACLFGLSYADMAYLLRACDHPQVGNLAAHPNGFWRVDKDKDVELRQPILTLIALHDLGGKIAACGGDRDQGIQAFMIQNDGEGWMLPDTLRLADFGLGHDERAKHPQPVASRLGPRFYDWQLAQTAEESWRECQLHARNLLGETAYERILMASDAEDPSPKRVVGRFVPGDEDSRAPAQRDLFGTAAGTNPPARPMRHGRSSG
jgi:hypothetical protein